MPVSTPDPRVIHDSQHAPSLAAQDPQITQPRRPTSQPAAVVLAQSVFNAVNANGDAYVCYKPYKNGPHNGHYGNFVDNTAAPHQ